MEDIVEWFDFDLIYRLQKYGLEEFVPTIKDFLYDNKKIDESVKKFLFDENLKFFDGHVLWSRRLALCASREEILQLTLLKYRNRFETFMKDQFKKYKNVQQMQQNKILKSYMRSCDFCYISLDSLTLNILPEEIFQCVNLKSLSAYDILLSEVPHDIAKLQKLQYLRLSKNRLTSPSFPFSMAYCQNLEEIDLTNNKITILPAVFLFLKKLRIVNFTSLNDGSKRSFIPTKLHYEPHKSPELDTLVKEFHDRLLFNKSLGTDSYEIPPEKFTLFHFAAKVVIGMKINVFTCKNVPESCHEAVLDVAKTLNVCSVCHTSQSVSKSGYAIITVRSNYLGTKTTLFRFWTCSYDCANAIKDSPMNKVNLFRTNWERDYHDHTITDNSQFKKCCTIC